jgi:hypothetical protein
MNMQSSLGKIQVRTPKTPEELDAAAAAAWHKLGIPLFTPERLAQLPKQNRYLTLEEAVIAAANTLFGERKC